MIGVHIRICASKSHFACLLREDEGDGDGDFDPSVEANRGQSYTSAETARMFKLRRSMHQLASLHMQKEREVLTARSGPKKTKALIN